MKININKVLSFQLIYSKIKDQTPPIKTAYKLVKINEFVINEAKIRKEFLDNLIDKYGERDENGNLIEVNDGAGNKLDMARQDEWAPLIEDLNNLETDIPEDILLTFEELESLTLSVEEFSIINSFIKE